MKHELKTWPEFYVRIQEGSKTFDIRKCDRGFGVGDKLLLREYDMTPDPASGVYTGRQLWVEVTYITDFKQQEGYVVMAIRRCWNP